MRKKSAKRWAAKFSSELDQLDAYVAALEQSDLSALHMSLAYEAALVKLSVRFEHLMLHCLVASINNDTSTISQTMGITFPKHMSDEVCEYLITGGRYFDFRGRSGLLKTIRNYLPSTHWLYVSVKAPKYAKPIDQLLALRNYAAHESRQGKKIASTAVGSQVASAGAYVKQGDRFINLTKSLRSLGNDIYTAAPY